MCKQSGSFYSQPEIESAVRYFRKNANGFVDFGFAYEDIKQEAAIAYWLADNKSTNVISKRLVDAYRQKGLIKRRTVKPIFISISEEKLNDDTHKSNYFWFEFSNKIKKYNSIYPELTQFVILYYIDELTKSEIQKQLNIDSKRINSLIAATKYLALEFLSYEF